MSRKIECDRCHNQDLVSKSSEWETVELSDRTAELCVSCVHDLRRFLQSIDPPTMVTSEHCYGGLLHVFGNDETQCRCGKYDIKVELKPMAPDTDIPF